MATGIENLPNDVNLLKKIVHEMTVSHAKELAEIKGQLQTEKEKYAALQRLVFGSKSEKKAPFVNPKQELLFNEAETFTEIGRAHV